MKKAYQLLLSLGLAVASLTSCSRSNYAVNQHVPASLSLQPEAVVGAPTSLETMARVVAPAAAKRLTKTVSFATVELSDKQISPPTAVVIKAAHPSMMQRLAIKKVARQVAKIQSIRQNTAHTERAASNVKNSLFVLLAGLVIILIGGIIGGANIVVTIGGIVFVVGLILLVISLIKG